MDGRSSPRLSVINRNAPHLLQDRHFKSGLKTRPLTRARRAAISDFIVPCPPPSARPSETDPVQRSRPQQQRPKAHVGQTGGSGPGGGGQQGSFGAEAVLPDLLPDAVCKARRQLHRCTKEQDPAPAAAAVVTESAEEPPCKITRSAVRRDRAAAAEASGVATVVIGQVEPKEVPAKERRRRGSSLCGLAGLNQEIWAQLVVEAGEQCKCTIATGDVCGSCMAWEVLVLSGTAGGWVEGTEERSEGGSVKAGTRLCAAAAVQVRDGGGRWLGNKGLGPRQGVVDEFPTWWRCPV